MITFIKSSLKLYIYIVTKNLYTFTLANFNILFIRYYTTKNYYFFNVIHFIYFMTVAIKIFSNDIGTA